MEAQTAVVMRLDEVPPPAPPSGAVTPMQMLQIALQQGADLDKLEKLMALQERWEKTEAVKQYNAAFAAFNLDHPTRKINLIDAQTVGF